ncbi:DUF2075 domain-containing protein [Hymenobacter sp. BT188]|uniref:DUF2075 domain-containing protein n=1 Tax=Hymenobacter sp. BT188 TaxID=2763504 RepID=UPI0016518860|nr:DUF2075 domain-containing protein [Hymenobacter sp. BT188]MBC6609091.1 DUF2075 domain-containing protein [Hymenobacter sp. BT188]
MRLYAGSSNEFIAATTHNSIVGTLKAAFFAHYRTEPQPNEVTSWHNSLRCVSRVFEDAGLLDHGVLLEYQLPLTSKRLDCLICGHDANQQSQAVIIELKQWSNSQPSAGSNEVVTWLNGQLSDVLHPSAQVGQYCQYLADVHTAFNGTEAAIGLHACAYLHNYSFQSADALLEPKFTQLVSDYPVYGAQQSVDLGHYLQQRLAGGNGQSVLQRIDAGRYRPSKKLLEHVDNIMRKKSSYVLLDDQLLVYDRVRTAVLDAHENQVKTSVLVKGGPGTGKSVIALHLLHDLLRREVKAHYATGSKAFTENLRSQFGSRSNGFFTYFNAYGHAIPNSLDVVICDEAHRIRSSSNSRFTRSEQRSDLPQVEELLQVAWVSVFFIDDFQRVRPGEIGSYNILKQAAEQQGVTIAEFKLEAQFRCAGSSGFINWLDNTLGIQRTANVLWNVSQGYDFQIISSPVQIEEMLEQRRQEGHTARMVAGFCWPWSDPLPDGQLVENIIIETDEFSYYRPWNAKDNAGRLAAGIPKTSLWATAPGGVNQVGCIYTAQGFEFDYVGVIVGTDLVYRQQQGGWLAQGSASSDTAINNYRVRPQEQLEFLRNTYKVLMTRGTQGCYVYFQDEETGRFFQSRME